MCWIFISLEQLKLKSSKFYTQVGLWMSNYPPLVIFRMDKARHFKLCISCFIIYVRKVSQCCNIARLGLLVFFAAVLLQLMVGQPSCFLHHLLKTGHSFCWLWCECCCWCTPSVNRCRNIVCYSTCCSPFRSYAVISTRICCHITAEIFKMLHLITANTYETDTG